MKTRYIFALNVVGPMAPHIAFFWMRIVIALCIFPTFKNPPSCACRFEALADDTIYILQFNIFLFYFVLSSLSQGNVLGYFLSIIMMIYNAGLAFLIMFINQKSLFRKDIICAGLFTVSYIFEAIMAVCTSYLKRHEMSFEFFKKVGADPRINDSYVTRKRLQTFGVINLFVSTAILGKALLPPFPKYTGASYIAIFIVILTYIQQIFVSANMKDEDVLQRNIAIYMSFVNISLLILLITLTALRSFKCVASTRAVQIFVCTDMLVIKIVMNIYLRNDKKKFGSGLKDYFKFRGQTLDLSK